MGTTADKLQSVLNSKNAIKNKFGLADDLPFSQYASSIVTDGDVFFKCKELYYPTGKYTAKLFVSMGTYSGQGIKFQLEYDHRVSRGGFQQYWTLKGDASNRIHYRGDGWYLHFDGSDVAYYPTTDPMEDFSHGRQWVSLSSMYDSVSVSSSTELMPDSAIRYWRGYRAEKKNGVWSFSDTITEYLPADPYKLVPTPNSIYNEDATAEIIRLFGVDYVVPYVNVSSTTAVAEDVKLGKVFFDANGNETVGTLDKINLKFYKCVEITDNIPENNYNLYITWKGGEEWTQVHFVQREEKSGFERVWNWQSSCIKYNEQLYRWEILYSKTIYSDTILVGYLETTDPSVKLYDAQWTAVSPHTSVFVDTNSRIWKGRVILKSVTGVFGHGDIVDNLAGEVYTWNVEKGIQVGGIYTDGGDVEAWAFRDGAVISSDIPRKNVSDTTALAEDVLEGRQFYNADGVLTQGMLVPQPGGEYYKCSAIGGGTWSGFKAVLVTETVEVQGEACVIVSGTNTDRDGVYKLVDSSATGTNRVWKHENKQYFIVWDNHNWCWLITDSTSVPEANLFYSQTDFGASDPYMGTWVSNVGGSVPTIIESTTAGAKTTSYYEFEETETTGLIYGSGLTPAVGGIYDSEALISIDAMTKDIVAELSVACDINNDLDDIQTSLSAFGEADTTITDVADVGDINEELNNLNNELSKIKG